MIINGGSSKIEITHNEAACFIDNVFIVLLVHFYIVVFNNTYFLVKICQLVKCLAF